MLLFFAKNTFFFSANFILNIAFFKVFWYNEKDDLKKHAKRRIGVQIWQNF